jgi:type I restriction enzyme S subunit
MSASSDHHPRIAAVLERRFPNNKIAPHHFGQLLTEYVEANIGPPHLVDEVETGDEGKLWSCIWEAMLYRHLRAQGYEPKGVAKPAGQHGPDFRIEHAGRTIWIEAVVPGPQGIPADYLDSPVPGGEICVKTKPNDQRVLRCTSAIADKRLKLDEYRAKGTIGANDCAVIAVNICRLSDLDPDGNGISQYPLSMEAVFPIGPLAVPITRDGRIDGHPQNVPRFAVRKASGKEIETANFLTPIFAGVSAVIQAHQRHMHEEKLVLSTVHNPLAINKLPTGLFGAYKEFVAEEHGEEYQVRDIRLETRLRELVESLTLRFRRREDRVVRTITAAESGDFVGERGKCHDNVNRWCFAHHDHIPARGWLISGDCVLDKHSLVNIGDGELVEITPMPDEARRTFLPHDGTEDEFIRLPNQIVSGR